MTSRARIASVLRVRRVQELQAAGAMAKAGAASTEAERVLGALHRHYDQHRDLDRVDAAVPDRLRDHEVRTMHARAIQHGRERVKEAVAALDLAQREFQVRSQAVRAIERLDERLAEEEALEADRAERRELDDLAGARALAGLVDER